MARDLDLVVIGTGVAASAVAFHCRAAGWSVAVIDSRPFGGTCPLRGCDPKKVLVGAAEVIDRCQRTQGKGFRGEQVRVEWPELMRFKRTFTEPVPKTREASFVKAGIVPFQGRARFVGPTSVRVSDDVLNSRRVVVAAGMRPATLNIPGEEHLTTSDEFLELDELPPRIILIGGGYISFEFAHVAARAGARVTVLHRGSRPLVRFDPDLVGMLVQRTRDLGVDVRLETQSAAVRRTTTGFAADASSASGQQQSFEGDIVVHGAGRVPEIDDLGLEQAGVEWDLRGVKVNDYLQSVSNPAVYAAGDAAASGGLPLTPVAGYEGRIVAANLLEGNRHTPDYSGVASAVFTMPPLASAGLQEHTAREQGLQFIKRHEETSSWYSSRRVGETCSGFKTLVEKETGLILGAHVLGPQADELVNFFAMAIRTRTRAAELKEALFAYPTHASDIAYML